MKTGKSNIDIIKDYLAGERPFVQVGYTGDANKHRKEGETWTDKEGIEWTKQDGKIIRLTKTQGDIIRDAIGDQKCCNCKMNIKWGSRYDQKAFSKTGMCIDCLAEYETRLKIIGAYGFYEKWKVISNQVGFLKDLEAKIQETVDYFSKNDGKIEILCNSEGFIERFHGTNKETILTNAKKDLKELRKLLKVLVKEKNSAKKEFKAKAAEHKVKVYV